MASQLESFSVDAREPSCKEVVMAESDGTKASGQQELFEEALASRVFKRVLRDIQVLGVLLVGVLGFFGIKLSLDLRAFEERLKQAEDSLEAESSKFEKTVQSELDKQMRRFAVSVADVERKEGELQAGINQTAAAARSASDAGELQKVIFRDLLGKVEDVGKITANVEYLTGDVKTQREGLEQQLADLQRYKGKLDNAQKEVADKLAKVDDVSRKLGCEWKAVRQRSTVSYPTLDLELSIGDIDDGKRLTGITVNSLAGRKIGSLDKAELVEGESGHLNVDDAHYRLHVSFLIDLDSNDLAGIEICRVPGEPVKAARM
jgi:hypothetical protein